MNDTRKTRLLTGVIIVLAVLNIGLLSWFFLRSDGRQHRAGRLQNQSFLADALHFDGQQRQALTKLQQMYFREIRPRQRQLRQARNAYFRLTDSSFTEAQRRERALAFHRQSAAVELLTLAHFDKVAKLCNPQQRQLLTELLRKLPDNRSGGRLFRAPGERSNRVKQNRTQPPESQQ